MGRPPYSPFQPSYMASWATFWSALHMSVTCIFVWHEWNIMWPLTSCGMAGRLGKRNVPLTSESHNYENGKYEDSEFTRCLSSLHNFFEMHFITIMKVVLLTILLELLLPLTSSFFLVGQNHWHHRSEGFQYGNTDCASLDPRDYSPSKILSTPTPSHAHIHA